MGRRTQPFQKLYTGDSDLDRVQAEVAKALDNLQLDILEGELLESVALVTGQANEVAHKLGRKLTGWQVVRQRADARIWDQQDDNNRPELTVDLRSSANVTVDLWVF